MTVDLENSTSKGFKEWFDFDVEETVDLLVRTTLSVTGFYPNTQVGIMLVDEVRIREINNEQRSVDSPTDVLSFPMLFYEEPERISQKQLCGQNAIDPDTNEIMLGDILVCAEKVLSQSKEYGHSARREFSFLITHGMLHLLGHDHIEADERKLMEERQRQILDGCNITRDV